MSAEKSSRSAGLPRRRAMLVEPKDSRDIGLEWVRLRGVPCQEKRLEERLPILGPVLLEPWGPKRFLYEDWNL